jgi:hypothetical protein
MKSTPARGNDWTVATIVLAVLLLTLAGGLLSR